MNAPECALHSEMGGGQGGAFLSPVSVCPIRPWHLSKQLCCALLVFLPSPQRTNFTRAQTMAVKVTTMFLELS